MSLFEFITVAVSIILSFGIVRLLDGLRPTLASDRRYWVHSAWVGVKLLNHATMWWGLWSFRESATWNVASFVWLLLLPGMLYLQATALVTTSPGTVPAWRNHFYEIRRWFFGVNVLMVVHTFLTLSLIADVPLSHPFNVTLAIPLAFSVLGALSANQRVHGAIAVIAFLNQILGFGTFLFLPGSLGAA